MKSSITEVLSGATLAFLIAITAVLPSYAQEVPDSLLGSFEGPLVLGRNNMNLAFTFSKNGDEYQATLISGGMGIFGMPADSVEIDGLNVTIRIARLDMEFTGTLRLDESGENITRIDGDWFQSSELVPVVLLPVESPSF